MYTHATIIYRCEILNHRIDGYEVWLHGRNQGHPGVKGLASVETEDILTPTDSRTRKNHRFKHLQANCDSYSYSFFSATISS